MLNLDKQIKMSEYEGIFDAVIPKNFILRMVKECIDFSFVNELMRDEYCANFGRPAHEPELILKMLFLEFYYDLSDREVESRASMDMGFKYFLDLRPEDKVPDSTTIVKFRRCKTTDQKLYAFLTEIVRQAVENKLIRGTSIIVDSTHTRSKHGPKSTSEVLKELTKEIRKEIYKTESKVARLFPDKPEDQNDAKEEIEYSERLFKALENIKIKSPKVKKKLKKLKEILENPKILEVKNENDQDAQIGHKSEDDSFFGYKNHIAITEEGIITAVTVTSGANPDCKEMSTLVEKTEENGVEVEAVIGDKAYSVSDNLKYGEDNNIEIISELKKNIGGSEYSNECVHFNKDADTYECINGFLANKSNSRKNNGECIETIYSFSICDCKSCPHKEKCITSKKDKNKRIFQRIIQPIFEKQKEFQKTDQFKEKMRMRWKIEQVNAHLKNHWGLRKARGSGLSSMTAQSLLCAITNNIVKITRMLTQ